MAMVSSMDLSMLKNFRRASCGRGSSHLSIGARMAVLAWPIRGQATSLCASVNRCSRKMSRRNTLNSAISMTTASRVSHRRMGKRSSLKDKAKISYFSMKSKNRQFCLVKGATLDLPSLVKLVRRTTTKRKTPTSFDDIYPIR